MANKKRTLKRLIIRLVVLLIIVLGLAVGGTWWYLYDHYIHPTRQEITETPLDVGLEFEEVQFKSHDGLLLKAWLVKPPIQYRSDSMPTILALHGYGTSRNDILERIKHLALAGFQVFTYDHRGSGDSEGTEVTMGVLELKDLLESAVPALLELPGVNTEKIAVYGYSMGGVLAINAAARDQTFTAVVADSPYASVKLMTEKVLGDRGLPAWPFVDLLRWSFKQNFGYDVEDITSTKVVGDISPRPLLLIHGDADTTVPLSHAEMIISAAREPKRLVVFEGHDHHDNGSPEIMNDTVIPFLKLALKIEEKPDSDENETDQSQPTGMN